MMSEVRRNVASLWENVRLALSSVFSNRLRAFLTMIGITIGVAGVVLLLSVGAAFEQYLVGQFFGNGVNYVALFAGTPGEEAEEPLTQREYELLSQPGNVPSAIVVAANLGVGGQVTYGNAETDPNIFGITPSYIDVERRELVAGRYILPEDEEGASRVVVMGSSTVEELFPPDVYPLGESIRINGAQFEVIGILEEGGSGGFVDLDNTLFVPMRTAQTRLTNNRAPNGDYIIFQILFQARDEESVDSLVQEVTDILREERDIQFSDEDSFTISTQDDLLESIGVILNLLTYFLAAIASISLVVGGIGIMNIMLVTVTERTKEIGLRKAVGAKNYEILFQFVTEAAFLSLLGGLVGIGLAATGGFVISSIPAVGLDVGVSTGSVILAVGVSLTIGVFFGYFPAQRAAKMNPIDALRYE